ncbi:DUF4114 domain-containing protein [Haloferula sargassicola]
MPRTLASLLLVTAGTVSAASKNKSIYQDPARPLGLSPVAKVSAAGSDAAAASFQLETLPVLLQFVNTNLGESQALADISAVSLDPQSITLSQDASVRVYFVSDGAGYSNTLGFTAADLSTGETTTQLIFPDASSENTYYTNLSRLSNSNALRDNAAPLVPGDFVDLGKVSTSSVLDFFLIADGANGGTQIYGTDASANPDLLSHIVAFALEDSPFLLIGFEDVYGGGDLDFNDLVIAVDIGAAKVAHLANPEPATWLMMGALAGAGWWFHRRPGSTASRRA